MEGKFAKYGVHKNGVCVCANFADMWVECKVSVQNSSMDIL